MLRMIGRCANGVDLRERWPGGWRYLYLCRARTEVCS
jgi:hypothetical protein